MAEGNGTTFEPDIEDLAGKIAALSLSKAVQLGNCLEKKHGIKAAAGGVIAAQDEATSVVWGMPGAVSSAGLCSAVLPLSDIGPYVRKAISRMAA
jgi:hypothetical protein